MNLLGVALVYVCALAILLDNDYYYNSFTFWAVLALSSIYALTKIK